MAARELDILIRGRDMLSPVLDNVGKKAVSTADLIRKAGEASGSDLVSKIGRTIGQVSGFEGGVAIERELAVARSEAERQYADDLKSTLEAERTALAMDKARVGAMQERAAAAATLQAELRAIEQQEKEAIASSPRVQAADIRETADENRAVAENAYLKVAERTAAVERESLEIEQARVKATEARNEAQRRYAESVRLVDERERATRRERFQANIARVGAKVGGAAFLASVGTNFVNNAADGIAEANAQLREAGQAWNTLGGFQTNAGIVARAIPIIGDAAKAFDKLTESIVDVATGRESIEEIKDAAAKVSKDIDAMTKRRKLVIDVITDYRDQQDPTRPVIRERDAAIREATELRQKSVINETQLHERLEAAEAIADKKLAEIRARSNQSFAAISEIAQDAFRRIDIAGAETIGDAFKIKLDEVAQATADRREMLQREIDALESSVESLQDKRIKRSLLEDAMKQVAAAGDAERNRVLIEQGRAEEQAAKDRAATVGEIVRQSVQNQVELGDLAAEVEARRLDIAKKYADQQAAIAETLKDQNLTVAERARLEAISAGLASQMERELERVGNAGVTVNPITGADRVASAVDARFTRAQFESRTSPLGSADPSRDQDQAAKSIAESNKAMLEQTKSMAAALREILAKMGVTPAV
jgi:hypothetical protein